MFIKVDVEVTPNLARRFNIPLTGFSVQLPIVVLLKNGAEIDRYPINDKNGVPVKVRHYKEKEIVNNFKIDTIYHQTSTNKK